MVKLFYNNTKCAMVDVVDKFDWFIVKAGVKQGCVMSGFLFLLVIDWINVLDHRVRKNRDSMKHNETA